MSKTQKSESSNQNESITIDENGDVKLPVVELLTGRGFITGKSGSGKSNSASVIAEELLSDGFPLLIVDTDGEYYGLKEEYEMLHVGADEECDLQVGPEHGEKLAELALEQNVPIILDVSGFLEDDEADELIKQTAHSLFTKEKKKKKPFLMLVEEVHEYIPEQGGLDDVGQMLVKIGKRGRKHGLGIVGISQRPADVKKDFITQCDWILWHRLTWNNDTKVVRKVTDKATADAVEDLDDGEAFLMADWSEEKTTRVRVRRKHTFDAGATPDLGEFERPELKSVSGDLVDELEDISAREERRQDRIGQLEQRVEELQAEKEALESELESAQDMRDLAQQMAEGLQQTGGNGDVASEKVDELISERNQLQKQVQERDAQIESLEAEISELREELQSRPAIDERAVEAVQVLAEEFGIGGSDTEKLQQKLKTARERIEELEEQQHAPDPDVLEHPSVERYISRMQSELQDLDEYESGMLEWFKYNGPGSVEDAYWHAGGSRKSSAKREKLKTLQNKDLVAKKERGEYEYALDDTVADWFADNNSVDADDVEAIVTEIESVLDE